MDTPTCNVIILFYRMLGGNVVFTVHAAPSSNPLKLRIGEGK